MTDPVFVRVVDLETTGSRPGPHGVVEIGWQDVVQEADGRWRVAGDAGARYVDPARPIPAVTMAIHHIEDADVAGAGLWPDVAPPVLRPDPRPQALAAHRAAFEQRFCTPPLTGGADWVCTWKCALRLWPDSPSFSNQVLRYWRKPAGLVRELGLPAHRAHPDAYVTAHHLRDMLNAASLAQLVAWSNEPGLFPRVPTGPERGKHWPDITDDTLAALAADRDEDVRFSARTEQRRRGSGAPRSDRLPPAQGALL